MSSIFREKIQVRVFAESSISSLGGNPLTIFLCDNSATTNDEAHSNLAKTCPWESVMIQNINHAFVHPEIAFYLPSGQSISYCAHAAMGAVAYIAQSKNISCGQIEYKCCSGGIDDDNNQQIQIAFVDSNTVTLITKKQLIEESVDEAIVKKLIDLVGLSKSNIITSADVPSILNASVSRSKTLVMIENSYILHAATGPSDAILFRDLCDSIQSTGLYLYSSVDTSSKQINDDVNVVSTLCYECRQFPRSSGYPEDPATGIAAMALACSLSKRGFGSTFEFYQGTAMGRRSKIVVKDDGESIHCSGLVLFEK